MKATQDTFATLLESLKATKRIRVGIRGIPKMLKHVKLIISVKLTQFLKPINLTFRLKINVEIRVDLTRKGQY